MDFDGRAGALAPEQQDVVGLETGLGQTGGARRGQQHQPSGGAVATKGLPGSVPGEPRQIDIVHRRTADAFVVDRKAARFDDVQRGAEAGSEAYESAEILRYIRLVQCKTHRFSVLSASASRKRLVRQAVTARFRPGLRPTQP